MNNTTQNNSWTQHPKGLPFLTATELWERFAFYIVQGLLVLYVVYQFHWTDSRSYSLAGAYSALVYMSPLLGGYLADHIIGQTKALLIGGVILIIGYGTLAMGTQLSMIAGLSAVILGNGLYKPNVSIKIIIKEYLNASNFFLDNSQTKYLNALLDNIAKKIRVNNA